MKALEQQKKQAVGLEDYGLAAQLKVKIDAIRMAAISGKEQTSTMGSQQ